MTNDDEIEDFLRRFQPKPAAALPPAEVRQGWRRWLIAAAVAVAATGGAWFVYRTGPGRGTPPVEKVLAANRTRPMSLGLAALRSGDPGVLERALDAEARRGLPDVTRRDGALRTLAAVGDG
ncbi:MAG: hypothetical protein ACHQNV_05920, partial [Vicinamibacteria bacterium]